MRAFALPTFFTAILLIDRHLTPRARNFALFSALLLITTFIKPSFASAFFPALTFYLIAAPIPLRLKFFASFIPVAVLLLWQINVIYLTSDITQPDKIIFAPLSVWGLCSPNPFISLLMAIAFPLSLLIFRRKNSTALALSWCTYLAAASMLIFLAEEKRLKDGNFGWGYDIALQLLFLSSAIEWLKWAKDPTANRTSLWLTGLLFMWHVCSGIIYLIPILKGGPFLN